MFRRHPSKTECTDRAHSTPWPELFITHLGQVVLLGVIPRPTANFILFPSSSRIRLLWCIMYGFLRMTFFLDGSFWIKFLIGKKASQHGSSKGLFEELTEFRCVYLSFQLCGSDFESRTQKSISCFQNMDSFSVA